MIDPIDLVEAARLLISGTAPGEARMRRAVSTAYYALFHALAAFAADRMIAPRDPSAAYALVYRGLDHKRIKDVLEDVTKPTLRMAVQKALGRTKVSAELRGFAATFVPMQQRRHIADYHPSFLFTLSDVGDLVDEAGKALVQFSLIDRGELTDVVAYMLVGARG